MYCYQMHIYLDVKLKTWAIAIQTTCTPYSVLDCSIYSPGSLFTSQLQIPHPQQHPPDPNSPPPAPERYSQSPKFAAAIPF